MNHNLKDQTTEIARCGGPGCHETTVVYEASYEQIQALIDLSFACSQDIKVSGHVAERELSTLCRFTHLLLLRKIRNPHVTFQ